MCVTYFTKKILYRLLNNTRSWIGPAPISRRNSIYTLVLEVSFSTRLELYPHWFHVKTIVPAGTNHACTHTESLHPDSNHRYLGIGRALLFVWNQNIGRLSGNYHATWIRNIKYQRKTQKITWNQFDHFRVSRPNVFVSKTYHFANFSSNQLFSCDLFSKTVTFTKFLPKMHAWKRIPVISTLCFSKFFSKTIFTRNFPFNRSNAWTRWGCFCRNNAWKRFVREI